MGKENITDTLKELPMHEMTGEEKFLCIAMKLSDGAHDQEIRIQEIKDSWSPSRLGQYNPAYYARAKGRNKAYILDIIPGRFVIGPKGFKHFDTLQNINLKEIRKTGKLFIFDKKQTHTFDKLVRSAMKKAKNQILIADSYVDESIIDNYLNNISDKTKIKVIYGKDCGSFVQRANRFKPQYQKFDFKNYKDLHDRFIICDDVGYVIGPSIKDAAVNTPAIVVALAKEESQLLEKFFGDLWKLGK